jgi:hypothetical protein
LLGSLGVAEVMAAVAFCAGAVKSICGATSVIRSFWCLTIDFQNHLTNESSSRISNLPSGRLVRSILRRWRSFTHEVGSTNAVARASPPYSKSLTFVARQHYVWLYDLQYDYCRYGDTATKPVATRASSLLNNFTYYLKV